MRSYTKIRGNNSSSSPQFLCYLPRLITALECRHVSLSMQISHKFAQRTHSSLLFRFCIRIRGIGALKFGKWPNSIRSNRYDIVDRHQVLFIIEIPTISRKQFALCSAQIARIMIICRQNVSFPNRDSSEIGCSSDWPLAFPSPLLCSAPSIPP